MNKHATMTPLVRRIARCVMMIVLTCAAAAPVLLPRLAIAADDVQAEQIELNVGEQRVLPTDNVQSYSEGVRGIVDVRLTRDASQFVVVALAPGQTTLLFLMQNGSEKVYRITVRDPDESKKRTEATSRLGPVDRRDNIRLDFYFVQLDKSYQHRIGIGWPASIGGATVSARYDLLSQSFESATAVVTNQPLPRLDMAQASGWAKLMRHAVVISANGEKAKFSGGGEVNIPVAGSLSSSIHQISFGSAIHVEPRYDAESGRLDLHVHAEVSDLTDDRGTGAPGRTTAALDTLVNLEMGQSLVLAGLSASSEAASKSGLPVLSQIPLLGALFGSHANARQDVENIVVIVPTVVQSTSREARRRILDALELYRDYSGNLNESRLVDDPSLSETTPPGGQEP